MIVLEIMQIDVYILTWSFQFTVNNIFEQEENFIEIYCSKNAKGINLRMNDDLFNLKSSYEAICIKFSWFNDRE